MFKKYALFGMLGAIAVLVLSAFRPLGYQPVISNAYSLADPGFRVPHMWNGYFIPSMEVTSRLGNTVKSSLAGPSAGNFRLSQMWNGYFIPAMDVTASLADLKGGLVLARSLALVSLRIPKVNSGH